MIGKDLGGEVGGASAALFFATLVSSIYWNKTGAFDRDCIQTLLGAWTLFVTLKFFRASREEKPKLAVVSAMVYGIYGLTWSGSLFIIMAILGGLILILLAGFGGKFFKNVSDPVGAIYSSIKMHLTTVIGVVLMMIVFTAVFSVTTGQQPVFWINISQTVVSFIFPGSGGEGLSTGAASEERPAGPLGDTFAKFYAEGLLTAIVVSLMIIALIKILWSRKPHELYILSWFIVLILMVWPDKGLARFDRMWWPLLPAMAGAGLGTIYSLFTGLSFDPSWEWLKKLQNPFLVAIVMIFFAAPFVVNAQNAAEGAAPPTEWNYRRGYDNGLLESFEWMRTNTPEGIIVSIEWSFGHLMTGVARRPSVVDGAGGDIGEELTWQTENREYVPPDYVDWQIGEGVDIVGSGTQNYHSYSINGRRPDADRLTVTGSEEELKFLLNTYRDNYLSQVDYIIFSKDALYAKDVLGTWQVTENRSSAKSVDSVDGDYLIEFENDNVVLLSSFTGAYIQGSGENLEGVLVEIVNYDYGIAYYLPYFRNDYQASKYVFTTMRIKDGKQQIAAFQLGDSRGRSMTHRIFQEYKIPPYLSVEYTSTNQLIKVVRVDHSLIP